MRKTIFYLTVVIFGITACTRKPENQTVPENRVYVTAQPALAAEFVVPVRLSGILGTRQQMKLSFKTGGIIKQVYIQEGDNVKKGQTLVSLDLSEIKAQAKQASIGLEKASRDLKRAKNLYADSVATLEQYQDARSAYELARAQKQIADFNLSHSTIKAPADGKIQKVLVEANEMIAPGYPAIVFASSENDWVVRVAMTDKDVVRFSPGDSAIITMDAYPGDTLIAEIAELGVLADPVTGTYESELQILDPMPGFRTGFICRAWVFPKQTQKGVLVPMDALLDAKDNKAVVYIFINGKAEKRDVITGTVKEGDVLVTSGIAAGDSLIVSGAPYITGDANVVLKK